MTRNLDNLNHATLVHCTGCGAEIWRQKGTVHSALSQGRFIWCTICWPDRKRELDRAYRQRVRQRSSYVSIRDSDYDVM